MQVVKRDGHIVDFDRSKIVVAIQKANAEVEVEEKIRRLKVRSGISVRPVLVYDGALDPQLTGGGYFAATVNAASLLNR